MLARVTRGVFAAALLGAATLACAAPAAGVKGAPVHRKGGLVPADVPRDRLEAAFRPRRLALVVGIQRFDDARWRPLRFPESDARAVAELLRDRDLGAFDAVRTVGPGATRADVRAALRDLAAEDRDERDTVMVYLSSHGTLARDASGQLRRYLVTRDTDLADVAGTGLSMDEVKAEFDQLRSRRKVLVLATCHSGGGKSLLPEGVARELAGIKSGFFVRPLEEVSRASVVLAASDWGETAREDEKLGHDVYTYFLLEALRGAGDRNGDGAITASEAHDHARRRTYEFTGGRQRPSAESTEVGADPIVLVGSPTRRGRPELFSYASSLDGFTVRVNGRPAADLPGGVAVDPGRLRVQVAKGDGPELVDETVRLSPGQRLDVAALIARGERPWEVAPRVALLSFLDARSRREVLGPVPGWGVTLTRRAWPSPDLALRLDLTTSAGRSRVRLPAGTAAFDYSALTAGVSLPWRIAGGGPGRPALVAGPRLSALWLARRFDLALAPPGQTYFTFTPGVLAGATLPIGRRVTAGAELHLDWTILQVDSESRSSGLLELLVGAGYRF